MGFINGFNFGCYGRDDFHGIDFEYFSEVNFYRVSLDSKAKNIKEEARTTKLLGQETLDIMREQVDPNSFKIVTTIKARLLYEEMISDKYIKEKIFDGFHHVFVVENNDQGLYGYGQLAALLRAKFCDPKIKGINKTDGLTWRVKDVLARVKAKLEEK